MVAPVHYWMQPPAADRADFVSMLRDRPVARVLAIAWLVVAGGLAWAAKADVIFGQPWYVRMLVLPAALFFLLGAVYALTLLMPLNQVRLEPDAVADIYGKSRTVHPLADVASYRLVDAARWRTLRIAKVDGVAVEYNVPLRIAPDAIHRYFAERGVPEGEAP